MWNLFANAFTMFALIVLAPACSRTAPVNISSWSVQIKTSGGFIGIGHGNTLVNSEGKVSYQKAAIPGKTEAPCEGTLTSDEVRLVAETVKQSKPGDWKIAGLDIAAPDAFGYSLEMITDGASHKIQWYDNTGDKLPSDVSKVYAAVNNAAAKTVKQCGA
jgi:hypothetical protein